MSDKYKTAIVYDWIDKWGGVERVLLTLHEMFPEVDFYTSYFDKEKAGWAKHLNIKTSFIQSLPKFIKSSRIFSLSFYSFAFETLDLTSYKTVISVSSSFAKSIITKPGTLHICYLLTPTRFLWVSPELYLSGYKRLATPLIDYFKSWDYIAAQRPDKIISISHTVAQRCQQVYGRESEVIYPPFDDNYWNKVKSKVKDQKSKLQLKSQKYYLTVSRLEPYKKVDIVIQAFNKLDEQLVIVGEGSSESKLKRIAGRNVMFLKKISDEELAQLYINARALIMPQEEDFGYVSLEAQFFGCPVIAYHKGGASETVMDVKSGIFFREQNPAAIIESLARFHTISYNLKENTRRVGIINVNKFCKEKFVKDFTDRITANK